jgi:hypothetical protein
MSSSTVHFPGGYLVQANEGQTEPTVLRIRCCQCKEPVHWLTRSTRTTDGPVPVSYPLWTAHPCGHSGIVDTETVLRVTTLGLDDPDRDQALLDWLDRP